jgi:aspartate/methionine/tyrosine aminotransferase
MRFSGLTDDFGGATNRLYERLGELRSQGARILDLVNGNVNEAGIVFPEHILAEAIAEGLGASRVYRPDSLGQALARESVSSYEMVPPDQIVMTPGTSVSYWYVFKLLCESGDHVLCPQPSYPLFDYIARIGDIEIRPYRLDERRSWSIDLEHLESQIHRRTRAIVLISPHNPTGAIATRDEIDELARIARRHSLAIVSDEVFREFLAEGVEHARPSATDAPLVFTLNGVSKMLALPGLKIGWMAVSGDAAHVARSMKALELISDAFLPVQEPAQFALGLLLDRGRDFLDAYRRSMRERMSAALQALGPRVGTAPKGGFHIVLPVPREIDEEDLALELLDDENILVHPGFFYNIEGTHLAHAVVAPPDVLAEALGRVGPHLGG